MSRRQAPAVWAGSHLDTVPRGGKFDGALGVVAAIEAVERVRRGSVAVFRGEEVGCIGQPGSSPTRRSSRRVPGAARRAGPTARRRRRAARHRHGDRRLRARRGRRRGPAGHAGTTPMAMRDDALVKPAEQMLALPRRGSRRSTGRGRYRRPHRCRAWGVNVIPGRVRPTAWTCAPRTRTGSRRSDRADGDRRLARGAARRDEPRCRRRRCGAVVAARGTCRSSSWPPARGTMRASSPGPGSRAACSSSGPERRRLPLTGRAFLRGRRRAGDRRPRGALERL